MAHATRGHRSGTYEIQELLAVDPDALTITYRHAGAYQPQPARLTADHTPAARQLLQAMADSIKVADNGDSDSGWESAYSLINACWYGKIMLAELLKLGFDDFADTRIGVPVLRALYQPLSGNMRRSACWLLARVVRANHPNGRAVAAALKNTRFSVEDTQPFTYDEAVSDAIEASARGVYLARYTAQRELFQRLGYPVDGRSWLRIPAEEVIDWAHRAPGRLRARRTPAPGRRHLRTPGRLGPHAPGHVRLRQAPAAPQPAHPRPVDGRHR